ncbi:MAG: Uma2 family endonuclease [Gemmatimonadaceae bacterium]
MRSNQYYTAEMVRALIREDQHWPRYEAVHGQLLVTPAPPPMHQEAVVRLVVALHDFAMRTGAGRVVASPADVSWGLLDTIVQPDVFVIPADQSRLHEWKDLRAISLAIEIVSPASEKSDRVTKRTLYQERGVPLYWIVDITARQVEVWTPADTEPQIEREQVVWHPAGVADRCTLSLAELFRDV